jgi:predicted HNH restriction endonuclease
MWNTIEYGLKLSTIKMKQAKKKNINNPAYTFDFIKKKYREEENLNYDIEWIELMLTGSYEEELEEYTQTMQFFNKLEENKVFKQRLGSVEIDPELSAEYTKKVSGGKAKKVMQKGFDKVKGVTIAKALNDVGILVFVEAPKKPEEIIEKANNEESE